MNKLFNDVNFDNLTDGDVFQIITREPKLKFHLTIDLFCDAVNHG